MVTRFEPVTAEGAEGLAALLRDPGEAIVGLDFDGTLAPIVDDPDLARAHPGAVPALARLAPVVGTVAVVTGRPAAVAVEAGGFAGVPGLGRLVVLGHYGGERWDATTGQVRSADPGPGVRQVREELPAVLAELAVPRGTAVEDKGRAVAVHVRRTRDPEAALALLRRPLTDLAERHGLVLEPGRLVLELRPPGMDKGAALVALARERGGTDGRVSSVLFAGDDLGDLAAFAAVADLRAEGVPGITVCSASGEVPDLAGRADLVVDGPGGVVDLLEHLAATLRRPGA